MTKRKNIYPVAGKIAMAHLIGITIPKIEYDEENQEFIIPQVGEEEVNWKLDSAYIDHQRIIRKALLFKAAIYSGAYVGLNMYEKTYGNWEEEFDELNGELEKVEKDFQCYCDWIKAWDASGKDLLEYVKNVLEEELLTSQRTGAIRHIAEYLEKTEEHTVKASTLRLLCNGYIPFGLLSYSIPNIAPEWASTLESI